MRLALVLAFFIVSTFFSIAIYGQDVAELNRQEYIETIKGIEQKIWSLEGYIIDTSGCYWTATDPSGLFSYEAEQYVDTGAEPSPHFIKLKSYIYSKEQLQKIKDIKYPYRIHYFDKVKDEELVISNSNEVLEDDLPFKMKNVQVVFFEKRIDLFPSDAIVFDRSNFDILYVVTYKNGHTKKYRVDRSRKFQEYHN